MHPVKTTVTHDGQTQTWQRVNKPTARRYFNNGHEVYICPANFIPFNSWGFGSLVNNVTYGAVDFDTLTRDYEFYNCVDSETGRYAGFYVKVKG